MDILSEKEKVDWNRFIIENGGSFLQSWRWGEFQEALGRKVWRISDSGVAAMIVRHNLLFDKSYLYCPGGPIFKISNSKFLLAKANMAQPYISNEILKKFVSQTEKIAEQENAIFLKIEPLWEAEHSETKFPLGNLVSELKKSGFIKSSGIQRIEKTLVLDLHKSEEELLTGMKQKTRYNIKVAQKHGVEIRVSTQPEEDAKIFYQLSQETAQRNKFRIHPFRHYEKLLSVGHQDEILELKQGSSQQIKVNLFLAEYQEKIIAANIVVFFGKTAIYLHGASSGELSNLMAPYLLQWTQIQEAKKWGCEVYDFWGINEERWPGITRFKKGFGGKEVEYIGAYDYVFDKKWYWIYKMIKNIKNF